MNKSKTRATNTRLHADAMRLQRDSRRLREEMQAESMRLLDDMRATRRWDRWAFLACVCGLILACGFALGSWLMH